MTRRLEDNGDSHYYLVSTLARPGEVTRFAGAHVLSQRLTKSLRYDPLTVREKYARIGMTLPSLDVGKLGRSRLFAPLHSTPESQLERLDAGKRASQITFKDNNAVLAALTPEIRSLDLSDLKWCSISILPKVGINCANLVDLNFRNLTQMNDAAVVAVGSGCPRLSTLDLSGCLGISANGLLRCFDHWILLKSLKLHRCSQLFDKELGYGSSGSAVLYKQLVRCAQKCLENMVRQVPSIKALFLVFSSVLQHIPDDDNEQKIKVLRGSLDFASQGKYFKHGIMAQKLMNMTIDDDGNVLLDDLLTTFDKSDWKIDDDTQKNVARSFTEKGLHPTMVIRLNKFVTAALKAVGEEEFRELLEVCVHRASDIFDPADEELRSLKVSVADFQTHLKKHVDLGSALLQALSQKAQHLQELVLSYCSSLNPSHLIAWSAPGITHVDDESNQWHEYNSWVRTGEWKITQEQLQQSGDLKKLEEKFAEDEQVAKDALTKHSYKMTMLQMELAELKAKGAADVTTDTPKYKGELKTLSRKVGVAERNVSNATTVLADLEANIARVRKETADMFADLADGVRKRAPRPRTRLRKLDLSGCCKVNDESLAWMAAMCPQLETLKLVTCDQMCLGAPGLAAIVRGAGNFGSIDLAGCTQLDDSIIPAFKTWSFDSVYYFSFSGCNGISPSAFSSLLKACDKVEALELEGCTHVNEAHVSEILASGVKGGKGRLCRLNLNACPSITKAFLGKEAGKFPSVSIVKSFHPRHPSLVPTSIGAKPGGKNKKKVKKSDAQKKGKKKKK
jgi:hypothetical protein